jgi:heat shock protein HslJ
VPGSALTLTVSDGRLSVNAGCNTMGAAYAFADGTLQWTEPAAGTQMACEEALMAQDTWISGLLTDGMEAVLEGDTLTLTSGDVTITFLDKTVAEPAKPLVGTAWELQSIVTGGAVSSVPDGVETPTLVLTEDGKAQVFSGCNRGSGGYELDAGGSTVEFGPIAQTRMACKDAAAGVEASVMAVLDGSVPFVIDGNQLTLTKGSQGLAYSAG